MKITKYEHACLNITEGSSRLIIDPGIFDASFTDFVNITAVVITHIHPDHLDQDKISQIVAQNPEVTIFTTQEVADQLNNSAIQIPEREQPITIGDFTVEFFGQNHAAIDASYPAAQNIGVLVNNKLYYPGDSFTECTKSYDLLATPIHAPWLKFSETAEFIRSSSATKLFPTHNGFINDDGYALYERLLGGVCQETSKELLTLQPSESTEI